MSGSAAASRRIATALGVALLVPPWVAAPAMRCPAAAAIVTAQNPPAVPAAPAPTEVPKEGQAENRAKASQTVESLSSRDAAALLGKKVKGPNGEELGLIVDVLVDPEGRPRAAVIDFGGFLGVGSRKIAIDWKALDFTSLGRAGTVELGLDRAQIAAAPEYKPGTGGAEVVTAPPAPAPPVDTHK